MCCLLTFIVCPEDAGVKDDGSPRLNVSTAISVPQVPVYQDWLDRSQDGYGAKQSQYVLLVEIQNELVKLFTWALGLPLELENPLHALGEELFPSIAPAVVLRKRAHVGCDWESILASRAWWRGFVKLGQARRELVDVWKFFNQIASMF